MKPVPPFVRTFGPGDSGPDVEAVKRALVKAGHGQAENPDTPLFGAAAQKDLVAFKTMCKLESSATYTVAAHRFLAPYFDAFGASLLAKEAVALAKQNSPRAMYVAALQWMLAHKTLFNYAETRPIPVTLAPFETSQKITTDCSGSVTLAAKWSNNQDPNGLNFNGEGYTGTILTHCSHITVPQGDPGDLIVYGTDADPTGHHVVAILERVSATDFRVFSHGEQGDPSEMLHSQQVAGQPAGFVICRFLPI